MSSGPIEIDVRPMLARTMHYAQLLTIEDIAELFDVPLELLEGNAREIHGFEGDDS